MTGRLRYLIVVLLGVAILAVGIAGLATAVNANSNSRETASKFEESTIAGRIASCTSSTQLRALLTDLENIIAPLDRVMAAPPDDRVAALAFRSRIEAYTNTNLACSLLTPDQRKEALNP